MLELETEFKVLMHCGIYVDANKLNDGIYITHKPFLYRRDTTIEGLIEMAERAIADFGYTGISSNYFKNLRDCKLMDVELTIK